MKETIEAFYRAFEQKDAETMVSLYHDDVEFTDPAFGTLKGEKAKNMWRMLCQSAQDLTIEASQIKSDGNKGSAHWEAHYTFSQTNRKVHNKIDAEFVFEEGKIIRHIDHFDLHAWARQALGLKGLLLGGTRFFQKKLWQQTSKSLEKFESRQKNG